MEDESYVRVFTQAFSNMDDEEDVRRRLVKRAESMKLCLTDGVFSLCHHPTTNLFVSVLTVTPRKKEPAP